MDGLGSGMLDVVAPFPDLEGLMAHQSLLSGSNSGLWASTQPCYGQVK